MSMKDLVVCKFAGCNKVYDDPRFLPCGKRTCAAHIEAMTVKSDDCSIEDTSMIRCHFCQEMHTLPENGKGFPVDEFIPLLLGMKHSREHSAAKKSFDELTQLLDTLTKFDGERYMNDYFDKVEADIVQEKEVNLQKLLAYYQKLVDGVHERKVKCLRNLKTNKTVESELEAIKRQLVEHERKLNKDQLDFVLKTLDGDEDKWREIQSECNKVLETVKSLDGELKKKIIGDQMIQFKSNTNHVPNIKRTYCHLNAGSIDSTIIGNDQMKNDLLTLCDLSCTEFKLLYRASRDGFEASSFHAKCDNQPGTLTLIKTTRGFIFGGYTAVAWESASVWKADPKAFLFSLVNARSSPQLIPLKAGNANAICCNARYGPSFGSGCDLYIDDNSNQRTTSYSLLGGSYSFHTSFVFGSAEAKSFLAGSRDFQTSEVEVFCLN